MIINYYYYKALSLLNMLGIVYVHMYIYDF